MLPQVSSGFLVILWCWVACCRHSNCTALLHVNKKYITLFFSFIRAFNILGHVTYFGTNILDKNTRTKS
jgi:hypothetical protein